MIVLSLGLGVCETWVIELLKFFFLSGMARW